MFNNFVSVQKSSHGYYLFGMAMPGRQITSSEYRFRFNGKENDDEVKGTGNQQDYGFRIYDTRLGKFLSVDPLFKEYPWYTPYQFAGNKPIWAIDLGGLEEYYATSGSLIGKIGNNSQLRVVNEKDIKTVKNYIAWANKTKEIKNKEHAITQANLFSTDANLQSSDLNSPTKLESVIEQKKGTIENIETKIESIQNEIDKVNDDYKIVKESIGQATDGEVVDDGASLNFISERMRANRKIDKLTDKKEVFTKIKDNWNNVIKFLSGKKSEGEEKK